MQVDMDHSWTVKIETRPSLKSSLSLVYISVPDDISDIEARERERSVVTLFKIVPTKSKPDPVSA